MNQVIDERERLVTLYKTYSDEELLRLSRAEESLRPEAQTAVTEELAARGLEYGPASEELESGFGAGIPGMFPSGAAAMEQALEPGGEVRDGMAELSSFFDGHELTRACDALEAAGVGLAIRQREGNAMTGSPAWFEVWVAEADTDRAQSVLREKLGLFPLAEMEGSDPPEGIDDPSESGMSTVAVMDTQAEAAAAVRQLEAKGFTARVNTAEPGEQGVAVEVRHSEREAALEALAANLGLSPSA